MKDERKPPQKMQERTKALLKQHITGEIDEKHNFEVSVDLDINIDSLVQKARGVNTSLTEAIELLEEARDLKQGITWIRVPHGEGEIPDLIRDARKATATEAPKNSPESYAIQKLNILRAALKIAEIQNINLSGNETKGRIGNLRDNATAALGLEDSKIQQRDVKKFNTDVVSFLASIGVKEPAKKLALIKDFMNFEDTHYNISTISTVEGKTVVESETILTGLTDAQKASLTTLITAKEGKTQTFEQKIIANFQGKIIDGLHTIPTQLRKSLPGLKNAYLKTTYMQEDGKPLEAIASVYHTGAISFHGKDNKQSFTIQNARQLQSLLPESALINQNVLNSPANPTGIDADIHRLTGKAMEETGGLRSTTPFNFWRKFSRNDNTGHEATLKALAQLAGDYTSLFGNKATEQIRNYIEGKRGANLSEARTALESIDTTEIKSLLEHAIEARRVMSNRSVIFDSNNDNLTISAHMASINHAVHNKDGIIRRNVEQLKKSNDESVQKEGASIDRFIDLNLPRLVINCASGKDRTGLAMIMATHFAVCEKLGKDPLDSTQSADIFKQIVKSGHTQEMASMNAGTRGCHGIKKDTLGAFPAWMQATVTGLQQDTASFNKFKHNPKKVKIYSELQAEHGIEAPKGFFARLWSSVTSFFKRSTHETAAPAPDNPRPPSLTADDIPDGRNRITIIPDELGQRPKLEKSWVKANPTEKLFDNLIDKFKTALESPDSKNLDNDFQGLLVTANKTERIKKLEEAVSKMNDSDLKTSFESRIAQKAKQIGSSRQP